MAVPSTLPNGIERTEAVRLGPSGSATHTATRRRAHGLHAFTLPLDVERTETVRSGPSGSALHMELRAQGRVAVPTTLPLDVERTEDVALAPDDLAYAKAVALPRAVPGHPRLAGPMTSSGNVPL